jgi:nitrite reductase/ring-hydroxylating ferredoxin subunit
LVKLSHSRWLKSPKRRTLLQKLPVLFLGLFAVAGCRGQGRKEAVERVVSLSVREEELAMGVTAVPVDNIALLRDDLGVAAMQLTCTHMKCQLRVKESLLECPCHGSRFDTSGEALNGPAREPLAFYELSRRDGTLIVNLSKEVASSWRLKRSDRKVSKSLSLLN